MITPRKIVKLCCDEDYRFNVLFPFGVYNRLSDEEYLKRFFKMRIGHFPNLDNPKTFNEKMQWLKLHDRNPKYTQMVDKYEAKKYVASIIGEEYIIPTLGIWEHFNDIDFNQLPNQFVLKCTHDSGGLAICKDKEEFDYLGTRTMINRSLKQNFYCIGREWPYKDVQPRIIAEKYMQDGTYAFLPVYKVFNFSGKAKLIQAIQDDKQPNESIDYYDINWGKLELRQNYPNSKKPLKKPEKLKQMIDISEELSSGIPFVRTDFYVINNDLYFSEFTFYSDSGFQKFIPPSWDEKLGEMISLPNN